MNDKNLKPCPFCGNTEVIYIPLSGCSGYVFCTDCNMATKTYWDEMAFADGVGAVADLIVDEAPTIEERKHGHWTKDNKCSECGAQRPTQGINKWIYLDAKYCYACGAKMDGENNG